MPFRSRGYLEKHRASTRRPVAPWALNPADQRPETRFDIPRSVRLRIPRSSSLPFHPLPQEPPERQRHVAVSRFERRTSEHWSTLDRHKKGNIRESISLGL